MSEPVGQGRVRILDTGVANQIAAGEVVERPASVLKELLENSLDARANEIVVELQRGGVGLIRVRDDGGGIHPDDFGLALSRHGTSKLTELEDLEALTTRGFRGEALPSIASVSRLVLRSRIETMSTGLEVRVSHGSLEDPRPVAMPVGTEVEVRDLFFNTPARRRFLKTERTELGHLEAVLRNAALAAPETALSARHGDRRMLAVRPSPEDRFARVSAVFGRAFSRNVQPVLHVAGDYRLTGWVMMPDAAMTTVPPQHMFLNGRPVRDAAIRHALGAAYEGLLAAGRQAGYVLYLDMPAGEVDVNVHPAKTEVRFHDVRNVHDFVMVAVRHALAEVGQGESGVPGVAGNAIPWPIAPSYAPLRTPDSPPMGTYSATPSQARASVQGAEGMRQARVAHRLDDTSTATPTPGILLERRFLLFEREAALLIADIPETLKAAAKAVFVEALDGAALVSRPLLLPSSVDVVAATDARLRAHGTSLEQLGIIVKPVTERRWTLRQIPRCLRHTDPHVTLEAVVAAVGEDGIDLLPLCAAAADSLSPSERELKSDVAEAVGVLTRDGAPPHAPWGKTLDSATLKAWLDDGTGD